MKINLFDYLLIFNSFLQPKSDTNPSRKSISNFLITFCALTIFITPYGQSKAIAQETISSSASQGFKVTFNPPAGGKPQTSTGGASRSIGQCINQAENSDLPLTPLLPTETQGLTVASHPTILAYLPQTSAQQIFFSWQDEHNEEHYQTILPIENKAGIISLTLPENAPPLQVGKNYQWAIALMCGGRLQPDSPMIQGQIQRVEMTSSLSERLKNANALETAAFYGEAGIWYETVATLAQLQLAQPNDSNLTTNWKELLSSVGLEKVAESSLLEYNETNRI